jgi:hypothetical protein
MVVPLLEKYFDVSVRNDEQLIKLAAIVQRLMTGKMGGDGDGSVLLTEEEKKQLMTAIEETAKAINKPEVQEKKVEALEIKAE